MYRYSKVSQLIPMINHMIDACPAGFKFRSVCCCFGGCLFLGLGIRVDECLIIEV